MAECFKFSCLFFGVGRTPKTSTIDPLRLWYFNIHGQSEIVDIYLFFELTRFSLNIMMTKRFHLADSTILTGRPCQSYNMLS